MGGTMLAGHKLLQRLGAEVVEVAAIVDLPELGGSARLKAAGVPVILHPTMARYYGDLENASMETATTLRDAGILVAMQSGFEDYVPKTRVVLFEAAIAAANGLGLEGALRTITIDAAKILDIDDRVGSIAVGKDGDLALYDGDPFEYTSHCVGVLIDGQFEPGETYKQID